MHNGKYRKRNNKNYWNNYGNRIMDLCYIIIVISVITLCINIYNNFSSSGDSDSGASNNNIVYISPSKEDIESADKHPAKNYKQDTNKQQNNKNFNNVEDIGRQLVHYKGIIIDKRELSNQYTLVVESTAYWVMDPVDASGTGIAADGTKAVPWKTIAVDPKVIPLQSKVLVPGVGWCRANDTGSAIKGNIIDMAVESKSSAYKWGRKKGLEVLVIPPLKKGN